MNLIRIGLATLAAFVAYFATGSVFLHGAQPAPEAVGAALNGKVMFVNVRHVRRSSSAIR